MNKLRLATLLLALLAQTAVVSAQETPELPKPEKEHAWLEQLVGEWNTDAEAIFDPDKPPVKCEGTASTRAIGGFWIVSEVKGNPMGMPMTGIMTLGYDPHKKKYIGTWVDSMTNHLWTYEGTVDDAGKTLTLDAEGPNPATPGKTAKFQDVIEVKSKDHTVLRSSMQLPDGKWFQFMTMNHRRKK